MDRHAVPSTCTYSALYHPSRLVKTRMMRGFSNSLSISIRPRFFHHTAVCIPSHGVPPLIWLSTESLTISVRWSKRTSYISRVGTEVSSIHPPRYSWICGPPRLCHHSPLTALISSHATCQHHLLLNPLLNPLPLPTMRQRRAPSMIIHGHRV